MNDRLISKSFRSMMILMIFAGVVAMCGSVIDGVIIGNCLPAECMTAFGYASPVFIFLAAVGGVFANGGKVQCAALTGKGLYEEARQNYTRALLLSAVSSLLISAACLLLAERLAVFLGAEGALIGLTAEYIRGLAIGALPIILLQVITGYLGLDGGEVFGLYGAIAMSAVNIFLDLMIGLVWHGGLFEMALATSASYLAAILVQLPYYRRKNRLFRFVKFKCQPSKSLSIISTGLPSAVSRVCCCAAAIVLNHLLTACAGEIAVSACSVRNTMGNFVDAVLMGVTGTVPVFSGMFYGERNRDAMRASFKTACKFGMILSGGCGIILLVLAPQIAACVLKADAQTLAVTVTCLRFYAISLPGEMLAQILMYQYLATEKPLLSGLVCTMHHFVFVVLPALALRPVLGLNGIWLSWFISGVLPLLALLPFLRKYRSENGWDMWAAIDRDLEEDVVGIYQASVPDDMEAVMEATQKLREFCESKNLDGHKSFRLCLATEEIAGNIAQHGFANHKGGHFIDIRFTRTRDGRDLLSFRDNGVKFNPLEYKNRDSQYGLTIIRGITEKAEYHYIASMNCLNLTIS